MLSRPFFWRTHLLVNPCPDRSTPCARHRPFTNYLTASRTPRACLTDAGSYILLYSVRPRDPRMPRYRYPILGSLLVLDLVHTLVSFLLLSSSSLTSSISLDWIYLPGAQCPFPFPSPPWSPPLLGFFHGETPPRIIVREPLVAHQQQNKPGNWLFSRLQGIFGLGNNRST